MRKHQSGSGTKIFINANLTKKTSNLLAIVDS